MGPACAGMEVNMVLLASALVCMVFAQDPNKTYELDLEYVGKVGETCTVSDRDTMTMTLKILRGDQLLNENGNTEDNQMRAVRTVLGVDGGTRVREKWTFRKAARLVDGAEVSYPFEGKTVIATGGEDGWSFRYEGGDPLAGEELDSIRKLTDHKSKKKDEPSGKEMFAPGKPVRIGEAWKPGIDAIIRGFGGDEESMKIDKETSIAKLTLKAVSKRGGVEFGKIEGDFEFKILQFGPMKLNKPLAMKLSFELDACIDGSCPDGVMLMTMDMTGVRTSSIPGAEGQFTLDIEMAGKMGKTIISAPK